MSLCGIDDYPEVHSIKTPVARKQYTCEECNSEISPGEKYRRDFLVYCGEAETHIICQTCDELMSKFFVAIPKEYRGEITFEMGGLRRAVLELQREYGVFAECFAQKQKE